MFIVWCKLQFSFNRYKHFRFTVTSMWFINRCVINFLKNVQYIQCSFNSKSNNVLYLKKALYELYNKDIDFVFYHGVLHFIVWQLHSKFGGVINAKNKIFLWLGRWLYDLSYRCMVFLVVYCSPLYGNLIAVTRKKGHIGLIY